MRSFNFASAGTSIKYFQVLGPQEFAKLNSWTPPGGKCQKEMHIVKFIEAVLKKSTSCS